MFSEADSEAKKQQIIRNPVTTEDAPPRRQELIVAGESAKAMEVDGQVAKVIASFKRNRDVMDGCPA